MFNDESHNIDYYDVKLINSPTSLTRDRVTRQVIQLKSL